MTTRRQRIAITIFTPFAMMGAYVAAFFVYWAGLDYQAGKAFALAGVTLPMVIAGVIVTAGVGTIVWDMVSDYINYDDK